MENDNPFWRFSLAVYSRPDVPAACLKLQADHGADVNLLLFFCWCASAGKSLSHSAIDDACAAVGDWHRDVVVSLRAVRSGLKNDARGLDAAVAEAFRSKVKKIELEAERLEQEQLFTRSAALLSDAVETDDVVEAAKAMMTGYLGRISDVPPDRQALSVLASAAGAN